MTVVYVSGDIGSGKSSFCAALAKLGAEWISSDALVAELYAADGSLVDELERGLGRGLRNADGQLDRARLSDAVFGSAESREIVESIVHPRVQTRLRELLSQTSAPLVVYEVTALKHSTDTSLADVVVEVSATQEVRQARLEARGLSASEAARRISAQLEDSDRRHDVDVRIDNSGDTLALTGLAERYYDEWTSRND